MGEGEPSSICSIHTHTSCPLVQGRDAAKSPVPARNPSFRNVPGGKGREATGSFRNTGGRSSGNSGDGGRQAAIEKWNMEYQLSGGQQAGGRYRGANVSSFCYRLSADSLCIMYRTNWYHYSIWGMH